MSADPSPGCACNKIFAQTQHTVWRFRLACVRKVILAARFVLVIGIDHDFSACDRVNDSFRGTLDTISGKRGSICVN